MDVTWMITMFALIDIAMTHLDHQTDVRAGVSDCEMVTVALVAAEYFAIITARFILCPAHLHDTTAVDDLVCTLPFGSVLFGDHGYVSESLRHHLDTRYSVTMIAIHHTNMSSGATTLMIAPQAQGELP